MKSKTESFTYESLQDCESIVGYLHALAEGFAKGSIQLASNGNEVLLDPQGLLKLAIKARRGRHRCNMALQVSWRHDRPRREDAVESLEIKPAPAAE